MNHINQSPSLIAGLDMNPEMNSGRFADRFPRIFTTAAAASLLLASCGRGDGEATPAPEATSPQTAAPTTEPVPTTIMATTTTDTIEVTTTIEATTTTDTVAATTTSEPTAEFSYVLEDIACGQAECSGELPANFPLDARNPINPLGLTLGEFIALGKGAEVCVRTTDGNLPGRTGVGAAVTSISGVPTFASVQVVDATGIAFALNTARYGLTPDSDGVTWNQYQFITAGPC